MRLILDTHIFLWALASPKQIPEKQRAIIASPANTIYVSAVSIAEIAIKVSIGKLHVDVDLIAEAGNAGFDMLDFTGEDAAGLQALPFHHRDPFDRMLIVQGIRRDLPIMTKDPYFKHYGCPLLQIS